MNKAEQNGTVIRYRSASKKVLVIGALAAGKSITDTAKETGVGRTTIYKWLQDDPYFVADLNQAKADVADSIRSELRDLAHQSLGVLRDLLAEDVPAEIRLKAALATLRTVGGVERLIPAYGPTDPERVLKQRDQARKAQALFDRLAEQGELGV